MSRVSVEVKPDYLKTLAGVAPLSAVSELIWNALDADAGSVKVTVSENAIGGLSTIQVADNGDGLPHDDAAAAFKNLGGSSKRGLRKTRTGRFLHGALGKGRFRAFALGEHVIWRSRSRKNGGIEEYEIEGRVAELGTFDISEPSAGSPEGGTGMTVTISDPPETRALDESSAIPKLTEDFAPYLRLYPNVAIRYQGTKIDPSSVEEEVTDFDIGEVEVEDGRTVRASLTVVEWRIDTGRSLYLCDENGFTLHQIRAGIQAPGFDNFTAYLKSEYLRELDEVGSLVLEDMQPGLGRLIPIAKAKLREHFRERAAEKARHLVEEWKRQEVYPYSGDPKTSVERVGRQVFDVVALNVNAYSPNFEQVDSKSKRLAFRLLREAIESSPAAVQQILQDVLDLPRERQEELAALLKKTPLEKIIRASKVVADRLNFLLALETLVFVEPHRSVLLERRQLHRIVQEETWIFGEEFNLTASEASLTTVLRKHVEALGIELADDSPVTTDAGVEGRVDLMFGRAVPQPRPQQHEYLVVELKRPTAKIDDAAALQVKNYARALANDERFANTDTSWVFWAVSSEMSPSVKDETRQPNRQRGVLLEDPDGRYRIWVRTWSEIIREARARLEFFQKTLEYRADQESSRAYLDQTHEKYLPRTMTAAEPEADARPS